MDCSKKTVFKSCHLGIVGI